MAVSLVKKAPLGTDNSATPIGRGIIEPDPGGWQGVALTEWELTKAEWTDRHPHEEINYVLEGELHVESEGRTVIARAGDTVCVTPGSTGRYLAPDHARMLAIYGPNPKGLSSDQFNYRRY